LESKGRFLFEPIAFATLHELDIRNK